MATRTTDLRWFYLDHSKDKDAFNDDPFSEGKAENVPADGVNATIAALLAVPNVTDIVVATTWDGVRYVSTYTRHITSGWERTTTVEGGG